MEPFLPSLWEGTSLCSRAGKSTKNDWTVPFSLLFLLTIAIFIQIQVDLFFGKSVVEN